MNHENENVTGGLGLERGMGTADAIGSVFPVLFGVVVLTCGVFLMVLAASSLERYRKLRGVLEAGRRLFVLFGYGVVTLVPLAILGVPVYLFANAESTTQVGILKWVGITLGAFLAVSGLGWLAEKWWRRVIVFHNLVRAENRPDGVEETK